jgi:hypothetical protein
MTAGPLSDYSPSGSDVRVVYRTTQFKALSNEKPHETPSLMCLNLFCRNPRLRYGLRGKWPGDERNIRPGAD